MILLCCLVILNKKLAHAADGSVTGLKLEFEALNTFFIHFLSFFTF